MDAKKSSSDSRRFTLAGRLKVVSWIGGLLNPKFCPNVAVENEVPKWDILPHGTDYKSVYLVRRDAVYSGR